MYFFQKGVRMENPKIKYKYITPKDLNKVYVNGVIGGVSPRGEFVINFFNESLPIPTSQDYELISKDDGTISLGSIISEQNDFSNNEYPRHIESSLCMSIESAVNLKNWLEQTLTQIGK